MQKPTTKQIGMAAALAGGGVLLARTLTRSDGPSIAGQVVLITGGSKGLGIALAREFAKQGCRLAICARHAEELNSARRELAAKGADVLAVTCDVTDEAAVNRMVEEVTAHFGQIDILVNNAGQIAVGPITSMTVADFSSAMDVMFWGTVYPTLAILPAFTKRRAGRIVNITSFGGKVGIPHLVPYTSAKFAATGFSEGLRAELKSEGITVTTIAPGLMRTGSYTNALFKGDHEAEARWFSLGASMPVFTLEADDAAEEIVKATRRGDAERILTAPAKAMSAAHGLFPSLTADLLGALMVALLPKQTGMKNSSVPGSKVKLLESPTMRALLYFGRLAADRYRQRA